MMKAIIPSHKLMTRRDTSLELMVIESFHLPELVELRKNLTALEKRANTIRMEANWRRDGYQPVTPFTTTEDDVDELPALEEKISTLHAEEGELRSEEEILIGKMCWVAAKREGFLAGIKYAANVFHRSPGDMLQLLCALGDEAYADQLLHDITKHMPDPEQTLERYLPLPEEPVAQAASAQQEGGDAE